MRFQQWLRLFGAGVALLAAPPARAVSVTWSFSAEVAAVTGTPAELAALAAGGIGVGAAVTGFLTFESDAADDDPDPLFGQYFEALTDFHAQFPALAVDFDGDSPQPIFVNVEGGGLPFVYAAQADATDSSGFFAALVAALELVDSSNSAFTGDSLPLAPPPLSALDPYDPTQAETLGFTTQLLVVWSDTAVVDAELVTLVPEPGSLALLASGVALALLSRRARQR